MDDYFRQAEFKRHRRRVATAIPFVNSKLEKYYKLRHKPKAPPGKNLDPTWDHNKEHNVKYENDRLVEAFRRIMTEKQLDNHFVPPVMINKQAGREARDRALARDNAILANWIRNSRSSYSCKAFAQKYKELQRRQEFRRAMRGQQVVPKSELASRFNRTFKRLKKKRRAPKTRAVPKPAEDEPQPSPEVREGVSADGTRWVTVDNLVVSGEPYAFQCERRGEGAEALLLMRFEPNPGTLGTNGKTREIQIPYNDFALCFEAFPRLLDDENFGELIMISTEFIKVNRSQIAVDLGPVTRLGTKISSEAVVPQRSRPRRAERKGFMKGASRGLAGKRRAPVSPTGHRAFSAMSAVRKSYEGAEENAIYFRSHSIVGANRPGSNAGDTQEFMVRNEE